MLDNIYVRAYNVDMIKLKNENKKTEGEEKRMPIDYAVGVKRMSQLVDAKIVKDTFHASNILAGLFHIPKESTLDALIDYRGRGIGRA